MLKISRFILALTLVVASGMAIQRTTTGPAITTTPGSVANSGTIGTLNVSTSDPAGITTITDGSPATCAYLRIKVYADEKGPALLEFSAETNGSIAVLPRRPPTITIKQIEARCENKWRMTTLP